MSKLWSAVEYLGGVVIERYRFVRGWTELVLYHYFGGSRER